MILLVFTIPYYAVCLPVCLAFFALAELLSLLNKVISSRFKNCKCLEKVSRKVSSVAASVLGIPEENSEKVLVTYKLA